MGGGKGSNKTTSAFKLPPEFIKAYNESLGLAREAIQQPYTPYTGQLVAGLTPGQQQAIANIQASQGMALPYIQEGAGLTREAARGITPELYERFYSPYVRDVASATQANLLESAAQQRSGLKSGAIQAGAFGGDRGGIAQAEMARQQQLANAQAMANIYNQGYGQAMGLAGQQVQNLGAMGGQLAGMGTTAQNAVLQGAQAQLAAGAQEQATAQAQLQAAYDQFLQQQAYPFQIAQYFANIAQGLGSTAGGTSTTTAPGPNVGSQILGGLGAIANIAGSLPPSDKRVKENIEAVGTLNDGQTVYRYNFKGNPQTQIGLLAQEVEEVKPGSVVEVGGIKRVDYKGATDDAASSMGGVVEPGDDRQGFMNGGMPYGGVGFVPNNPMMVGASNKIPGAVMPTPDAGLAGASDMTQPFTDQQKQGVANIAGLFKKPSIYNAGGAVGRNAYADGGVPFMPYSGSRGWIPEGKLGGGGSSIPKAPDAYVDKGLSEDWQAIKPFTDEQRENLSLFPGKIRAMFADPEMAAASYMNQPSIYETYDPATVLADKYGGFTEGFASGGVAGRGGYQIGGEPTMEETLAEAEALREPQGVAAAEAAPKRSSEFRLPSNKEVEAYIADAARKRGIDPGIAIRVWRSEGATGNPAEAWQSKIINKRGEREKSYGPYQLYMEGGLGNEMQKATGLSPADPRNWQPSVDFALDKAAEGGWGPWMGAKAIGLAPDAGLGGARAVGQYAARGVGDLPAPSGYSDTKIMPVSAEAAPEGVAAAERDRTPFNLKNLFASEDRPSIVEQVMGRRLSPEARSAMLNASFALMAGRSPFFFTNLGEAGRVGTQTYYNALQQKRELEKQRADIARQGFEAETGRMQVNVAEMNASRQLYAQMLPQIRFWQMRNPGKPLPPEFQRVIDAAFPQNAVSGTSSMAAGVPVAPADVSGGAAPVEGAPAGAAPAGAMPEPGAATGEPSAIPAPDAGAAPISGNSELDALYSQLPEQLNPNYWTQMAENAMTVDDYNAASERAAELTKQYQENGIPLPSGVVPFPGTIERQQQEKLSGLQTEGAYKATSEQTERAQTTVAAYQTSKNTLDQAAEKLAKTKTGQLEETKAYLVTSLNSLGLVKDAELLRQATGVQELRKVFSQILFSGGLKDKIGSQIAAKELEMFAAGFGDVNLEPAVNRFIVGTMRGILDMDAKRARDWIEFVRKPENKGKTFSRSDIVDWEINWNDENPVADFVNQSVANTPVMGEIDFSNAASRASAKPGYKYVIPKGRYPFGDLSKDTIVTFDGERFNEED